MKPKREALNNRLHHILSGVVAMGFGEFERQFDSYIITTPHLLQSTA